jgi:hypothetical protein
VILCASGTARNWIVSLSTGGWSSLSCRRRVNLSSQVSELILFRGQCSFLANHLYTNLKFELVKCGKAHTSRIRTRTIYTCLKYIEMDAGQSALQLVLISESTPFSPSQYSVLLQTGWPGFDPRQRQRIFPLTSASRPALGPPSLLYNGYGGLFPRGKVRPGRDADHLPPSSAEVKIE